MNEYILVVNICYNFFFMFLCIIFVFKMRNFFRNFNEVKYIGISMYLICFVWIVFFLSYFNMFSFYVRVYLIFGIFIVIGFIILCGFLVFKVVIFFFINGKNFSVVEYSIIVIMNNIINCKLSSNLCVGV